MVSGLVFYLVITFSAGYSGTVAIPFRTLEACKSQATIIREGAPGQKAFCITSDGF